MSFKILLLPPDADESWPEKIRRAVPGAVAKAFRDPEGAAVRADVLAEHEHLRVAPHLFAERLANRIHVADLARHATFLVV